MPGSSVGPAPNGSGSAPQAATPDNCCCPPTSTSTASATPGWFDNINLTRSDYINIYIAAFVALAGILGDTLLPQRCKCLLLSDSVNATLIAVGLLYG
ncbi:unnamed protein product, partial [Cyprideis torosa]